MKLSELEVRNPKNPKYVATIGKKYGEYEVIDNNYYYHKSSRMYHFHVKCSCGKENYLPIYQLENNISKICRSCSKKIEIEESYKIGRGLTKRWKYRTYKNLSAVMFFHIRQKCKERDLFWDDSITPEYLYNLYEKQNEKCILSGLDIKLSTKRRGVKPDFSEITASLDRINSSVGYIKGNLQWVHKEINIMKNNHKQEHFIQLCILVSNYANTEPSQTGSCLEGAETSGSDTNLSGNTTNSVQQPNKETYNPLYSDWCPASF